jgi:hypothetical protein
MSTKQIYHVKGGDIPILKVFSFKGHHLFQLYIDIDTYPSPINSFDIIFLIGNTLFYTNIRDCLIL